MPDTASAPTGNAAVSESEREESSNKPWRTVAYSLLVYALSRLFTLVAASLLGLVYPEFGMLHVLSTTWDGELYQAVLTEGYPKGGPSIDPRGVVGTAAFFPLYPILIRVTVLFLDISIPTASIVVSVVSGALAVVFVALVARLVAGSAVAERTATLFAFGPGAFVFSLAYSEGVMITFAAACLLFLLRKRWFLAGLAGAFATAARPNAVVLVACCIWAAWHAIRQDRDWRSLFAPLLAPIGGLAYLAFLYLRTGDVAYWFKVQREVWHDQVDFGRHNLQEFLRFVTDPLASPNRVLFGLSIILTAALVTVLVRAKLAVELNIFAFGIVLLALISQVLYPNPRFLLTAFPLTIALASSLRTNPYRLVLVASAAVMPLLLLFYAIGHLEQGNFPVQYFVAP